MADEDNERPPVRRRGAGAVTMQFDAFKDAAEFVEGDTGEEENAIFVPPPLPPGQQAEVARGEAGASQAGSSGASKGKLIAIAVLVALVMGGVGLWVGQLITGGEAAAAEGSDAAETVEPAAQSAGEEGAENLADDVIDIGAVEVDVSGEAESESEAGE